VAKEDYYGGTARYVLNLPTCDPIFFQTIDHPMVYHWSSTFMGHRIILGRLSTRIVRLEDPAQHLYGDILQPLIKKSAEFPVMMNTVWMLDDFPPEIGATRIVPGFHRSGYAQIPEGVEIKTSRQRLHQWGAC